MRTKPISWDFFISYASEDRDLADPIAKELVSRRYSVWYDQTEIEAGYSLSEKIDQGIASSHFGIVILSHDYFRKSWTNRELRGFVSRETIYARQAIIPVWHNVTKFDVFNFSPTLADQFGIDSSIGVGKIVERIFSLYKRELSAVKRIGNQQDLTRFIRHEAFTSKIDAFNPDNFEAISDQLERSRFVNASVAIIDIDDLTKINRNKGVDVGNFVLVRTFELIQRHVNEDQEVFCRCGDDTFLIINTRLSGADFENKIKFILAYVNTYIWESFCEGLHVSCSAGVSVKGRGEPMRDVVIRAAIGMQQAKRSPAMTMEVLRRQVDKVTDSGPKNRKTRRKEKHGYDPTVYKAKKPHVGKYSVSEGPSNLPAGAPRSYSSYFS